MIDFEVVDGKIVISFDPNKDGQPVIEIIIAIAEIPDEIMSVIKKG